MFYFPSNEKQYLFSLLSFIDFRAFSDFSRSSFVSVLSYFLITCIFSYIRAVAKCQKWLHVRHRIASHRLLFCVTSKTEDLSSVDGRDSIRDTSTSQSAGRLRSI